MGLAWGGFANGAIPLNQLTAVPNFRESGVSLISRGSNLMKTEAAFQLSRMMHDFFLQFNTPLSATELYRPLINQDYYWDRYINKKPGWTLAAKRGTSNHGWGLSGDLNVNGGNPSGVHLAWLRANAAKYGFVNDVASEPWHWTYRTDLVTRTIVQKFLIANPNTRDTPTPAPALDNQGDEGMDRLIRNKKTGSIDWINTATGFFWHTPNMDYVNAIKGFIGRDVEDMEDNWWGFYRDICATQRDAIANRAAELAATKVWTATIDGWNGKQSAMARLNGSDKKSGTLETAQQKSLVDAVIKALPTSSGGSAPVNIDIPDLVAAIVKGIADETAKRMQS